MRFLQTEWHRHERDRNAWEIEREEMKRRIGRLEGEAKTSKRLQGSLEKHVKILEMALKKERERLKGMSNGEQIKLDKDAKDLAREELKRVGSSISFAHFFRRACTDSMIDLPKGVSHFDEDIDPDNHLNQGIRQENERDKSKGFLTKCSSEITYNILPAGHIPSDLPEPGTTNHVFGQRQPTQQELEDAYIQLQQQKQQQLRNDMNMVHESPLPNHPILPAYHNISPLTRSTTQINHGALPVRGPEEKRLQDQISLTADDRRPMYSDMHLTNDEQIESVSHSYDAYGRELPVNEDSQTSQAIEAQKPDLSENWDFDEGPQAMNTKPEMPILQQRPDVDAFPNASMLPSKSPPGRGSYRRKSSGGRRRSEGTSDSSQLTGSMRGDASQFKVRFAMRGHLDVVRSVVFTGGGSPSEPEFCTASDDGVIKRWYIPSTYGNFGSTNSVQTNDLDHPAYFTHRGHVGAVCALAACHASPQFSNGGRSTGDGWVFSGGQDASVKVWERGRVDAKASLEGHKDAVWALCVLPGTTGSILGEACSRHGGPDRILLVAGAANGTILVWAVSAPPQLSSANAGSNRGARGSRRANSVSAGSNFPSSPQPSTATAIPFNYSLVHQIVRDDTPSPTHIGALSPNGENFVVSYTDASVLVFDTRTGEEIVGMASQETYDGTPSTGVNAVVANTQGFDTSSSPVPGRRGSMGEDDVVHGATGSEGGVEGVIITGYEDRYIRFFDANSGKFAFSLSMYKTADNVQANALILCWPTRQRSHPCRYHLTTESLYLQATTPVYVSGHWRRDPVHRRSQATASCVARVCAQWFGATTGGGLYPLVAMVW